MPLRRRLTIYLVAAGTWLTGGIWLILHYLIKAEDQFGFENADPAEHVWIVLHAGFSVLAIWAFGTLWLTHVKPGWFAKSNRVTGGFLFAVLVWLIASGFGLYYVGDAGLRSWTSLLHWIVGLAALLAFLIHSVRRLRGKSGTL